MSVKEKLTIAVLMRFVITPKDPTTAHVNQDMKGTEIIAQVISSFLTWSFCTPSKALLFLFFHDKMLFIAIFLNSRPYYLKILNGKFTTLTYCLVFLMFCLLTWLASETLLFCFFSCISSFFSVLASLFKKRRGVHSAN